MYILHGLYSDMAMSGPNDTLCLPVAAKISPGWRKFETALAQLGDPSCPLNPLYMIVYDVNKLLRESNEW